MTTCIVAPSARTMTLASTRLGCLNMTQTIADSVQAKTLRIGFGNGQRKTDEEQPKQSYILKQDGGSDPQNPQHKSNMSEQIEKEQIDTKIEKDKIYNCDCLEDEVSHDNTGETTDGKGKEAGKN